MGQDKSTLQKPISKLLIMIAMAALSVYCLVSLNSVLLNLVCFDHCQRVFNNNLYKSTVAESSEFRWLDSYTANNNLQNSSTEQTGCSFFFLMQEIFCDMHFD